MKVKTEGTERRRAR